MKPTREQIEHAVIEGIGHSRAIRGDIDNITDAVMALYEEKPSTTCNHFKWTLSDRGKGVVCDQCGLACGITMEVVGSEKPKWEEEFRKKFIVHDPSEGVDLLDVMDGGVKIKDFIREKMLEFGDDMECMGREALLKKWGI